MAGNLHSKIWYASRSLMLGTIVKFQHISKCLQALIHRQELHHASMSVSGVVACMLCMTTFQKVFLCVFVQALKAITFLQRAAVAATAVSALLAAVAVGAGHSSLSFWAAVGVSAVAAAFAAYRLAQVRQKFIFVDYVQADH